MKDTMKDKRNEHYPKFILYLYTASFIYRVRKNKTIKIGCKKLVVLIYTLAINFNSR